MQINTFDLYVESRLRAWAREICGGGTNLGYPSTNSLHRDYGLGGSRGVQMTDEAWITEQIMIELRKEAAEEAIVLEAVYRGYGRSDIERKEEAEYWLGRKLTKRQFWSLYEGGFGRVRSYFELLSKAA